MTGMSVRPPAVAGRFYPGTAAEVRTTADAWGVRYARVDSGTSDNYAMSHTADVYLVDGTGRLQTVEERANPRYHRLIAEFERQTGVPILLNTSFNENEPIVMTPEHAVETFRKTHMDLLVLGNHLVRRDGQASRATARSARAATRAR